jgi:dTDP-4-dehydrorhamnose reductase
MRVLVTGGAGFIGSHLCAGEGGGMALTVSSGGADDWEVGHDLELGHWTERFGT